MSGTATRKDYLLAATSGVETGAQIGLFSVKAPEVQMLSRQQRANALLAQHLGAQEKMARSLSSLDRTTRDTLELQRDQLTTSQDVAFGVSRLSDDVSSLSGNIQAGFDDLGQRVSVGLYQLDGAMRAGFGRVEESIVNVGGHLEQRLGEGFGLLDARLLQQGQHTRARISHGFDSLSSQITHESRTSRTHHSALTQWLGDQMDRGFGNVCDGLGTVDRTLTRGFEATTSVLAQQTTILDNRLAEVGSHVTRALELQHDLDRSTLIRVGELTVKAIRSEGQANRDAILAATRATITALSEQGHLIRGTLMHLAARVDARLTAIQSTIEDTLTKFGVATLDRLDVVADRLAQAAESESREHTRAALPFIRNGLYNDAKKSLTKAIDTYAGYYPAHFLLGIVSIYQDVPTVAEGFFRSAHAQAGTCDPARASRESSLALIMLGRLAGLRDDWVTAERLFSEAADLDERNLIAIVEQGHAILNNSARGSERDRAILVTRGLDRLPQQSRYLAWYGLALLLAERDSENAVSAFRRGLKLDSRAGEGALRIFKILCVFYPGLVPMLYHAIDTHAPEFRWVIRGDPE